MTRDYSQLFPSLKGTARNDAARTTLAKLGWQPFFAQQISVEDLTATPPVRVTQVHRSGLQVVGENIDTMVPPGPDATVGDWLLYDAERPAQSRVLQRKSLFKRRAPGHDRKEQLISANVDTAFIVTSCNRDFNIARLERFIALAFEAEASPVIVLTKSDLADDVEAYLEKARSISQNVPALALNALGDAPATDLAVWCAAGQTVAFLGSSGVGKSTLVNALMGNQSIATAGIREDDAKGRHTTTHRQLHFMANGCAVLDTPGMRELQMTDAQSGIAELFDDISTLADLCKFNDCKHETEPGCAVNAALERGEITPDRLARWNKLVAEERFNTATLAERKSGEKSLQKLIRQAQKSNRK